MSGGPAIAGLVKPNSAVTVAIIRCESERSFMGNPPYSEKDARGGRSVNSAL